jgi:Protein of unknown function (DUF2877)
MSAVLSPGIQTHALNIGALVPETGYVGQVRLATSATAYVDGFSASSEPLVLSLESAETSQPASPTSVQLGTHRWDDLAVGTRVSIENGQLLIENAGSPVLEFGLSHRVERRLKPITFATQHSDTVSEMPVSLESVMGQLQKGGGQALFDATLRLHDRMETFTAAFNRSEVLEQDFVTVPVSLDQATSEQFVSQRNEHQKPVSSSMGFNDQLTEIDLALHRLVGFGPGLTPSGDDALTGFLGTLQTIGNDQARAHANTVGTRVLSLLSTSPNATTFVSAQMLRSTIAGHITQPVIQLLEAVTETMTDSKPSRTEPIHAAVDVLLSHGATSGADTLVGILAACTVLQTQWSREIIV